MPNTDNIYLFILQTNLVHYDEKDSDLEKFVNGDFASHLHQMGCLYATRKHFACGSAVSDCVNSVIDQCSLFFLFPRPNIDTIRTTST